MSPHNPTYIPLTFVFKGPPGTGKTTVARKVGQIFYDMGFLAEPEVIECSVSHLLSGYVCLFAEITFVPVCINAT